MRKAKRRSRRPRPDLPILQNNPRRMLTFKEWCALNSFSVDQGRRILKGLVSGISPPKITQLSDRRIAIRADHNDEWQDARVRAPGA